MESIAPPSTRAIRGLKLFKEHSHEIVHEGHGIYRVPGCSGGTYTVDLKVFADEPETCTCPDFERHHAPCKHVFCATISRSRTRAKARREQADRSASRASRSSLAKMASL